MDKEYLLNHSSDRFNQLKKRLADYKPEYFYSIGEFVIDFVCFNNKVWIKILDEEHDHTDSYFLEAKLLEIAQSQGASLCFVDAAESIDENLKLIQAKVDSLKNNKI